jgi:hypothetical protein
MGDDLDTLRAKLEQAHAVIGRLIGSGHAHGAEGERALAYFASDRFDPDFLPWPRAQADGIRPEDLSAANDG